MPTIPKGSQEIPAPRRMPTPFFGVQAPREIFEGPARTSGAGAAADLGQLELLVQEERERARRQADEIVLLEARSKLAKVESDLLIRAQEKKGKDALGLLEETAKEWRKAAGEIASELAYDDQRRRFLALATEQEARLQRNIFEHVARESAAWDAEKTKEFAASERAAAVAAFTNPERLDQAVKSISEAYFGHAERNGKPKEWAEGVARKEITNAIEGAIYMSLTQRNLELASAYFEKYRPIIEPAAAVELSARIQQRLFEKQVEEATDAIFTPEHETIGTALEMAAKIEEPQLRRAVEERVRARWKDIQEAKEEVKGNALERAYTILEKTGGDLGRVPDDIMALLGFKGRQALAHFSETLKKPVIDQKKRDELISEFWLMSDEQRASLTKKDLMENYRPYVTSEDFDEISKAVKAARDKNYALYNELSDPKKVALQELQTLGLFPVDEKAASDFEKRRYATLLRQLALEVDRAKRQGKPVPELRDHIRSIIGRGELTPGDFFRGPKTKRFIDLKPGEPLVPPPEIRREIEAHIRSRGKTPTDELIEKLYSALYVWDEPRLYEEILSEAR